MRVIGTAGHVDHGKSALVAALTGVHPDRLKEEQAREMTIDLGFAWFTLPDGEEVAIVDVPGHRDFIENMLSGVGGIGAAMLVVAADEGIMPQTREHLAILDLLKIDAGVIVLTKVDLIDEPGWLDLVELDVRSAVVGTVLENAPLVRVSAKTRQGLAELIQALQVTLSNCPPHPDLDRARLPIDRVFSLPGFGTVVTGTLIDGSLRQGEEIEILPQGVRGRIRGLQSHKKKVDQALPGSRTAVNISGVNVDQIRRGDVAALPGRYRPTQRIDVHFRLLTDASAAIKHSAEVKLFIGACEVLARLRLLGVDELFPGQEGWLQLDLRHPIIAVRGDRYILRRPSPSETLGGGEIVDPHPDHRHRRFSRDVLDQLEAVRYGSPGDILFQAALAAGPAPLGEVAHRAGLSADQLEHAMQELLAKDQLVLLEAGERASNADGLICARPAWLQLQERIAAEIGEYHRIYPLRLGIPREELKSRLKLAPKAFAAAIRSVISQGSIIERGAYLSLAGRQVQFTNLQQAAIDRLLARFAQAPFTPPSVKEAQAEVGEDVFNALVELQHLAQVSPEVVFRMDDYLALIRWVEQHFQAHEELTVAQFRDAFNTSRRYALSFLEHLDALNITFRSGDVRRLRKKYADKKSANR